MFYKTLELEPMDLAGDRKQRRALQTAQSLPDFVAAMNALSPDDRRSVLRCLSSKTETDLIRQVRSQFAPMGPAEAYDIHGRPIRKLTPEQLEMVNMPLQGDTLIVKGVAGSGKTAIAVARLVRQARADRSLEGRYLLLTFGKSLQIACEEMIADQFGGQVPGNVDVLTYHAWAKSMLEACGYRFKLMSIKEIDLESLRTEVRRRLVESGDEGAAVWFDKTERQLGRFGSKSWKRELKAWSDLDWLFVDEPKNMHKLLVASTVALVCLEQRQSVAFCWSGLLLLRMSVRSAEAKSALPPYSEIVVDEVQDLYVSAWVSIEAVAQDTGAALVMMGDGRQTIHRDSFDWESLGFFGRAKERTIHTCELNRNFRSPPVLNYQAKRVIRVDEPVDHPGSVERVPALHLVDAKSCNVWSLTGDYVEYLFEQVDHGAQVCIAGYQKSDLDRLVEALRIRQLPVDYAKEPDNQGISLRDDSIKVMTIYDMKGLEFDHVIGYRLEYGTFPGRRYTWEQRGEDYDDVKKRFERMLFVLLTRAKKTVTVFANADATGKRYMTGLLTDPVDDHLLKRYVDEFPRLKP